MELLTTYLMGCFTIAFFVEQYRADRHLATQILNAQQNKIDRLTAEFLQVSAHVNEQQLERSNILALVSRVNAGGTTASYVFRKSIY